MVARDKAGASRQQAEKGMRSEIGGKGGFFAANLKLNPCSTGATCLLFPAGGAKRCGIGIDASG